METEILITKSRDGWPIIDKGDIYFFIRQREDYFVGVYPGSKHATHIPKDHAILRMPNQLTFEFF